jgi:hypothetical protein
VTDVVFVCPVPAACAVELTPPNALFGQLNVQRKPVWRTDVQLLGIAPREEPETPDGQLYVQRRPVATVKVQRFPLTLVVLPGQRKLET